MNLNHDVHTPPREENYLNGNIQDFTDCIDFTKQYQKSISCNNDDSEQIYSSPSPIPFKDTFYPQKPYSSEQSDNNIVTNNENSDDKNPKDPPPQEEKPQKPELENGKNFIEPDVSILIPESNLEKTINHVAKGVDSENNTKNVNGEAPHIPNVIKKKRVVNRKKNHIKIPNRNIKKKVGVLKFKNGRYMQKKKESQYQNILSNIKFRCYKCSNSEFGSLSELVVHQRKCLSGPQENPLLPQEPTPVAGPPPSNSKTPRKVYLCSACGNYYENWNLFLHMIEIHKRHICLYCLGMFSHPDKLAQHLHTKHNVIEQNLSSSEDFLRIYKGTCYFICCTCETMFSEQDEFNEHSCTGGTSNDDVGACPLCGLQGAHFPTCRRAFSDRYVDSGGYKSHPALGKKLTKKKVKKQKEVFRIENNGEMTVTVRKQQIEPESSIDNNNESDVVSPSRTTTEQYNEKMLQLYRSNKPVEKVTSTIQSIEESINRVVESSKIEEEEEEEEEEDTNLGSEEKPEESIKININISNINNMNIINNINNDTPPVDVKPDEISSKIDEVNDKITNGDINNDSDNESTDSEKLTIAFDQPVEKEEEEEPEGNCDKNEDAIPVAGSDIPFINVTLKDETEDVKALIKEFVKDSCWNCVYCAHAKRVAVNGKQLALHLIAEHRYSTLPAESSEEEKVESSSKVVEMLKENLNILENCYFNTDTFDSEDKSFWKANDRIYECFHCLFATYVHKELYSHNKKMHQKNVFLCIMCKSNFYNYSELLCHLCPGQYIPGVVINPDIKYRCFLCDVDPLPSSFRLMVHLRRRHNSCDICFDASTNQSQLSTHVWKHKLSHYCYLCGIAYRNKPDITKHLFWKHGTESVLCKKCLQKKWPHVYHFCIPPNSFTCDECSASLKSAVALKVHKRLHSGEFPYSCDQCEEKFISKKLLDKHLIKHEEEKNPPPPPTPPPIEEPPPEIENHVEETKENDVNNEDVEKKPEKEKKKKKKPLTDVFDLPPVNLSESDDSDEDEEINTPKPEIPQQVIPSPIQNAYLNGDVEKEPEVVDGVWNNFQNYLVSKDPSRSLRAASPFKNMSLSRIKAIMLSDHDYHIIPSSSSTELNSSKSDAEKSAEDKEKIGLDHDYCNNVSKSKTKNNKQKRHREGSKSSSSSDSSDSDSSCSCGSNCSCTSGSSSSSSSNESDSDEREKRRKEKKKVTKEEEEKVENEVEPEPEPQTEVDISVNDIEPPVENPIRDSDLETDETETDEDFYDDNPAREANRILAEKRFQLVANLNGSDVPVSSPSTPTEKTPVQKKKTKMKKKRSQPRPRASTGAPKVIRRKPPAVAPPPIVNNVLPPYGNQYNGNSTPIPHYEAQPLQAFSRLQDEENVHSSGDSDSKRPKRKRVPLKFYGFSSDDEAETTPAPKKREKVEHNTTTPAPSATSTPTVKSSREEIPTIWNPHSKNSLSWRVEKSDNTPPTPKVNPIKIRTSQTMRNNSVHYTSETTKSEVFQIKRPERNFQINGNSGITGQKKGEKLYCFCQCPYDEVSEMIACDAKDCVIEWFHFECVGIMVPPQGSWYCPDCRKKLAAENEFMPPPINEQNFN